MEPVEVWRAKHGDPTPAAGPLPGVRDGDVAAYDLDLPEGFEPWPGHDRTERIYLLLDLGISLSRPSWRTWTRQDGSVAPGLDGRTWYVDLVAVTDHRGGLLSTDLYLDVMVCLDGRHPRVLDLDELADAVDVGLDPAIAMDGLRRFQAFLDRHLYPDRHPSATYADFPPRAIADLVALPRFGDSSAV